MKTIEDRTKEWVRKNLFASGGAAERMLKAALTELAADLNAEKEKEVAELRAWKESALKVMPDFQKLGKLLGLPLGSDVSDQLIPAIEQMQRLIATLVDGQALLLDVKRVLAIIDHPETPECRCDTCRFVRARTQLLTRLGGSHE